MMDDPGYASYQDPRLQPPDEGDPTPAECMEQCVHRDACIMQYAKWHGWDECRRMICAAERLADDLGCSVDCDEWVEV